MKSPIRRSWVVVSIVGSLAVGLVGAQEERLDEGCSASQEAVLVPWIFGDDFELGTLCPWSTAVGGDPLDCTVCGDGFVVQEESEQCDDGGLVDGDGCSDTCQYD